MIISFHRVFLPLLLLGSMSLGDAITQSLNSKEARFDAIRDLILHEDLGIERQGEVQLYGMVKHYVGRMFFNLSSQEIEGILQELTSEAFEGIKDGEIQDDKQLYKFTQSLVKEEYGDKEAPISDSNRDKYEEQFLSLKRDISNPDPQIVQDAYTELFTLVQKQISNLLRIVPWDRREDLTQEIVLTVFKGMKQGRMESGLHLLRYSRLVARGKVGLYFSPEVSRDKIERESVDIEGLLYFLHKKQDPSDNPLRIAQQNQLVEKALGDLPPRQREIVSLYYLEEKTESEIAQKLGCAPSNISLILRRSVKIMRQTMIDLGVLSLEDKTENEDAYLREVEKKYSEFIEEMGFRPRNRGKGGETEREIRLNAQVQNARLKPNFGKGISDKAKQILGDLQTAGPRRTYAEINDYVGKYHALPYSQSNPMTRFKRYYFNTVFKAGLTEESLNLLYTRGQAQKARSRMRFIETLNQHVEENQKLPSSDSKIMRRYRSEYKDDDYVKTRLSDEVLKKIKDREANRAAQVTAECDRQLGAIAR